jgi:hypothetical protein
MAFLKSQVSVPMVLEPGSCQAEQVHANLARPLNRVPVTPEWLAENEAKQKAYEAKRAEWRKLAAIKNFY